MFRLTAARIAVIGAGVSAAVGGIVAAAATAGTPTIATLTAAQSTPNPSGSSAAPATAPTTKNKHHGLELRLRRALIEATAQATGQTVKQVREQLRAGKSLDDIAGSKAADVKTAVLNDVRARAEKAVDAKEITQAQADRIVDRASRAIDRIMAAHHTPKTAPKATPAA